MEANIYLSFNIDMKWLNNGIRKKNEIRKKKC